MDRISESNLKFILKNYKTNDSTYFDEIISTAYSLYEIWFNLYKKLIFENYDNIRYSMLLKGAEPLKFGILFFQKDGKVISPKYENLYKHFLTKAYELVIIILHQTNFLTVKNFLQDYIYSIQFLNLYESCDEIIISHNYNLITIATFIANLYQEERIGQEYLKFLLTIFNETKYISIGYDAVLYTEPLSISGIHEITKDTHYYFILSIIYTLSLLNNTKSKQDLLNIIVNKINYSKNDDYIFETLLDRIKLMDDIKSYNQNDINLIKNIIEKQNSIKKQKKFEDLQKLFNQKVSSSLPELLDKDIAEYTKHFSYCSIINNEQFTPIVLPTGFSFAHSGNYIADTSSYDIFGIYDHFTFIDAFIFNQYIHYAAVINITSFEDIIGIYPNNEKIEIISSIKYHSYFYTLKDIEYDEGDIIYKNKRIKITFERSISDYLIIKNDIKNHIYMKPLIFTEEEKTKYTRKEEDSETNSIYIYKDYKPEFFINTHSEIKIYSIIGVQEEI